MAWLDLERKHSLMLRQKSRVKWDVEGDENKAYFHSLFKRRNSRNSLGGVMSNGVWIVDPGKIKEATLDFFGNKFKEVMEDNWRPRFVNSKFKKLSSDLAGALEAPFSEVEVWSTIKDCGGSKAPGPDDFTFKFFKEFWDTIKADVM